MVDKIIDIQDSYNCTSGCAHESFRMIGSFDFKRQERQGITSKLNWLVFPLIPFAERKFG